MLSCPVDREQTACVRRRPPSHDRRGIVLRRRPWARNRRAGGNADGGRAKGCVAPYPVDRNTQQFRAVSVKLRENLVVKRHLIATDRAPFGGIDRQDYGLTPQIRKREVLIGG